jgi:hypothetical protein
MLQAMSTLRLLSGTIWPQSLLWRFVRKLRLLRSGPSLVAARVCRSIELSKQEWSWRRVEAASCK